MERKIMSLGKSSLVISLPKEWMQLNDLKKGDTVSFNIQRDRSLVIYPSALKKSEPKEITLKHRTKRRRTSHNTKNPRRLPKRLLRNHAHFRKNFHGTSNESNSATWRGGST